MQVLGPIWGGGGGGGGGGGVYRESGTETMQPPAHAAVREKVRTYFAGVSELILKGRFRFSFVVNSGLCIRGCSNQNDQHLAGNMLLFYIHGPDTAFRC